MHVSLHPAESISTALDSSINCNLGDIDITPNGRASNGFKNLLSQENANFDLHDTTFQFTQYLPVLYVLSLQYS